MSTSTTLMGLAASPGIAIGRCWPVDRRRVRTPKRRIEAVEVSAEMARLHAALELSDQQLAEVRAKVQQLEGNEHTAIIDMHRVMLRDEVLVKGAQRFIEKERVNAECGRVSFSNA